MVRVAEAFTGAGKRFSRVAPRNSLEEDAFCGVCGSLTIIWGGACSCGGDDNNLCVCRRPYGIGACRGSSAGFGIGAGLEDSLGLGGCRRLGNGFDDDNGSVKPDVNSRVIFRGLVLVE